MSDLLQQAVASGQVSAAQVQAHWEAGELGWLSVRASIESAWAKVNLDAQIAQLTADRDDWKESCVMANERFKRAEAKLAAANDALAAIAASSEKRGPQCSD